MGLKLGFETRDSLFPRGRDTGQGVGTREQAQYMDEHIAKVSEVIFISPSDFPTAALPSRNLVGYRDALNFDGGAQENAQGASFIIPDSWIDKQLKFTIWWTSQLAGAGNVYWKLYLQWNESEERLFSDHTLTQSVIDTKTTSGFVQAVSFETTGKVFKKDAFIGLRIYRFGNDVLDTLAVEADFLGITIEVVD